MRSKLKFAFRSKSKSLSIGALFLLSGCGLDLASFNSTATDALAYKDLVLDTTNPAVARFAAARNVLKSNCMNCHQHGSWGAYTEAEFISARLVAPGDVNGSSLHQRLNGYGATGGMPQGGASISASEHTAITTWIENISTSDGSGGGGATGGNAQRWASVQEILKNRCNSCHNVSKTSTRLYPGATVPAFGTGTYLTDQTRFSAIGSGSQLVEPGFPETSWLYQSLIGSGNANASMPKNGANLSASQVQSIREWILRWNEP